MTAFRIEIPDKVLAEYDKLVLEMADGLSRSWCDIHGGEIAYETDWESSISVLHGRNVPPESVTYFAAVSQGHPLHEIIAKLEELLSD